MLWALTIALATPTVQTLLAALTALAIRAFQETDIVALVRRLYIFLLLQYDISTQRTLILPINFELYLFCFLNSF